MKHIIGCVVLLVLVISLTGCAKKYNLEYDFDDYRIALKTSETFDNQNLSDVERAQDIQVISKQISETGYRDSLFISNVDISTDTGEITLDKFMALNKKTLESRFVGYKENKYSDLSFDCRGEKIKGKLLSFSVTLQDQKIYFSHYVFSKNNSGYLISFSSESSKQIKLFKGFLKDIRCK